MADVTIATSASRNRSSIQYLRGIAAIACSVVLGASIHRGRDREEFEAIACSVVLGASILAVILGVLVYRFVETPMLQLLRGGCLRGRAATSAP